MTLDRLADGLLAALAVLGGFYLGVATYAKREQLRLDREWAADRLRLANETTAQLKGPRRCPRCGMTMVAVPFVVPPTDGEGKWPS